MVWWAPRCPCGCWLTPWSSYGFDVIDFAAVTVGAPLDPWQRIAVIHAGELRPDGRPRFRTVLVLVARQNGKTHLLVVLALYWLLVEHQETIFGTSTNLPYAKESWQKTINMCRAAGYGGHIDEIRETNGQEELTMIDGCRYKIGASNRRGGRSLTINRLIGDELREHHDWSAYNAAYNAMNAVDDAQAWFITNQGDDRGVVLDTLRADALEEIESGADTDTCLLEWSAPDGSAVDDPAALRAANPNLGRRLDVATMLTAARRARRRGGDLEAGFKTEALCMRVRSLNPAIDGGAWSRCLDVGDLQGVRSGVALCLDVAPDLQHATLAAAAQLGDGRVRVEIVAAWSGPRAVDELRRDFAVWVARVRPVRAGWLPGGPAAALTVDMRVRPAGAPRGMEVAEIRGEVAAVCMGFAEQVAAGLVAHSGDPLLDAQVAAVEPDWRKDTWVFIRRGAGHADATYAAAGAVHLAREVPPPRGPLRLIVADEPE